MDSRLRGNDGCFRNDPRNAETPSHAADGLAVAIRCRTA